MANPQVVAQRPQGPPMMVPRVRVLRLGVVLGGKIVEERLVRDRSNVSIGQSAKNSFSIPIPELPKEWALFQVIGGRYHVNIAEGMDCRIGDGSQVFTAAQIKSSGAVQRTNVGWRIPLTDSMRGKIVLGDLTVLFQQVALPPVSPKPQLPPSVRGRLGDRIDPWMAVVLAISLSLHGGFTAYLWQKDSPLPPPPDQIPDRFAKLTMEKPVAIEPPKQVELVTKGPEKEVPKEGPKGPPIKKPGDGGDSASRGPKGPAGPPGETKAPDHAAVAQAVQNTAVLKVLGAKSEGGTGRFADVTGGKDPGGDLGKGLDNVGKSGVTVAASGPGGLGGGTRGPATGEIGTGRYTGVGGPAGTGGVGTERSEDAIKTDVRTGPLDTIDAGGLDPDKVMSTIKSRYFSGVRQCYERALKGNPTLQGKVVVSISIGPAGNVTKASVSGFDNGVDQCIQQKARGWRFMKPESGSAEFEIPFILRPGG